MNYNDVFLRKRILENIPLCYEDRQVSKSMKVTLVMMKVAYDKEAQVYEKEMEEVLKSLKKEGFDERAQAYASMQDVYKKVKEAAEWNKDLKDDKGNAVPKPTTPTKEEVETAAKTKEGEAEFLKEREELYSDYGDARTKKGEEEANTIDRKFTTEQFSEIIEMIGSEGAIELSGLAEKSVSMTKEAFFAFVGSHLVEL